MRSLPACSVDLSWPQRKVCLQIEQAKAEADKKKGEMSSLESELQKANARARELEEEARHARCILQLQMTSVGCVPRVSVPGC